MANKFFTQAFLTLLLLALPLVSAGQDAVAVKTARIKDLAIYNWKSGAGDGRQPERHVRRLADQGAYR